MHPAQCAAPAETTQKDKSSASHASLTTCVSFGSACPFQRTAGTARRTFASVVRILVHFRLCVGTHALTSAVFNVFVLTLQRCSIMPYRNKQSWGKPIFFSPGENLELFLFPIMSNNFFSFPSSSSLRVLPWHFLHLGFSPAPSAFSCNSFDFHFVHFLSLLFLCISSFFVVCNFQPLVSHRQLA